MELTFDEDIRIYISYRWDQSKEAPFDVILAKEIADFYNKGAVEYQFFLQTRYSGR